MGQVVFCACLTKKFSKGAFLELFLAILHIRAKNNAFLGEENNLSSGKPLNQ